jgi:predicted transcriptional regulator
LHNGLNKEEYGPPDNKQRIYAYVKHNPGSHLRKISKDLAIAMGDAQYHLTILEKTSLIKSRRIGFYRTYYSVSILGERYESILAILQQETPREIVLYLIENPGATQSDIVYRIGFTAPTIIWHMSRLIEINLVQRRSKGKFVRYYLQGDMNDIITLLKAYHPSVWDKLSNRLAELFVDISSAASMSEESNNIAGHASKSLTTDEKEREDNHNNIDVGDI